MTKLIRTSALLGLASGFCTSEGFGAIHEAAEWVAGHPIWTHEFAEKALWKRLQEAVYRDIPTLREFGDRMTKDTWAAVEAECIQAHGVAVEIEQGAGERAEHPLDSLARIAPGKPTIAVVVKE